MAANIGTLQAFIVADDSGLLKATRRSMAAMDRTAKTAAVMSAKVAAGFDKVGRSLTIGVTLPVIAAGAAVLKLSGDFEASMNTVRAITNATGKEFLDLRNKALDLGTTTKFSASEAAGGITVLAKNGLKYAAIMDGALDASLALAAAMDTSLANAADIATDAMLGFNRQAKDLPALMDGISNVTISSKFDIDDYRLALGQAGGVAGKLGVTFRDFNTSLAATASSFASGSDAGTSFKTFLTRLSPISKEAMSLQKRLGIEFFDGAGAMKSMEGVTRELAKAFSGMSDEQKTFAATTLFGTDSMRTALTLASVGVEGFKKYAEQIDVVGTSTRLADEKTKGLAGKIKELRSAAEGLAIAIGDSGLLRAFTEIIKESSAFVRELAVLNPEVLSMAVQVALVAAAAGPAAILMAKLFSVISGGFTVLSSLLTVVGLIATPLGLIAAGAVAGAVALAQMIGPVDALAVGWQALEEAWTFWVKQFQAGVTFLVRKTGELKVLSTAADLIGQSWVALRTVFSLVLSGIGTAIGNVVGGLSGILTGGKAAAEFLGVDLGRGVDSAIASLGLFSDAAFEFGDTNAQVAADTASEWDTAFVSLKKTGATFTAATKGAFVALQNAGSEALEILQGNAEDKAERIQALFDRIKGSVLTLGAQLQGGVEVAGGGGGAGTPLPGVGGAGQADVAGLAAAIAAAEAAAEVVGNARAQKEWETYARVSEGLVAGPAATSALQTWFDANAATLENFKDLAEQTFVNFADGFSNAVAAVLVEGKSFRGAIVGIMRQTSSQIIAQMIKTAIATVALSQTETVAKGVKAAPHPFLIPAFAALSLAAFAAAISGTAGSSMVGGGGGGGGAAVAQTTGPVESTVIRDNDSGSTVGEGAAGGGGGVQEMRAVIDAEGIGHLMTLILTESKNGAGDGSGDTLAIARA